MHELRRLTDVYALRRATGKEDRYLPYEPANLFRLQRLERDLTRSLRAARLLPLGERRVLDAGCGGGWWLRTLLRWGAQPAHLTGVDLLDTALSGARAVHPDLALTRADLAQLPFANGAFDLVSQFTVFSSILDEAVRRDSAAELLRVLRPGGVLLWYDFTLNPGNRDTHGIGLTELAALFPGCRLQARRVTLAPPLTRLVAPRSWLLAEVLENIPLLRTHILALIQKPHPRRGTG